MKKIIMCALMMAIAIPSLVFAQVNISTKKITWFLSTKSDLTGSTQSYPPDTDTTILLPPDIAKVWECQILHADPAKDGSKYRQVICFQKDQQGHYSSFVSNSSQCYLDGTKRGTEIGHLTIATIIPDVTHNPKLVLIELDLYCSIK